MNHGQFVKACNMLHGLLHRHRLPDGVGLEQLHGAGLYLCARLAECPPSQARTLSADRLVDIAVECGEIDHYAMQPPFRLLYTHHRAEWPRLRKRIIHSESWSAMYAVSLVLADEHANQPRAVLSEITELLASPELDEKELWLYALKLLEADSADLMETARGFAARRGFVVPALIHEFLLTHALLRADACEFIQRAGLWNTPWPYHRTQLDDIAAVQELVRRSPTPFSEEAGVARARDELAVSFGSRNELLTSPVTAADPVVQDLLRNYERLPRKRKDLTPGRSAESIRRSALMDRVLLLLFAHPAWEVRAGASTIAAAIAFGRPEVARLIGDWIDHPDYRVRYSAIETAYRMRHQDDGALFERAVRRHADDEQAWVRGIVADCLAEGVVREGKQGYAQRLDRFKLQDS